MTHSECIRKLKTIGSHFGFFSADGIKLGKMYHMGNPDCVWYYDCRGKEPLLKISKGDKCNLLKSSKGDKSNLKKCKRHGKCEYLPFIAFEVPNSEDEKALRGSLMTLQLTNASASIIVLIGESAKKHKSFVDKLVGRYSFARIRIWTEDYVKRLSDKIAKREQSQLKRLESYLKTKYDLAIGQLSLERLERRVDFSKTKIEVTGRSYKTGEKKTISIPIEVSLCK